MAQDKPTEDPQHSPKMGWGKLSIIATVVVLVLYFVGMALVDMALDHREATQLAEVSQPTPPDPADKPDVAPGDPDPEPVDGAAVYGRVCVACHGAEGLGVPGAFPPLTETEWVTGDPEIPIAVVLKGLAGPVTVKGERYNNAMPAQERTLNDAEIAAVVTYIRSSWGNDASPVEVTEVQELRTRYADRTRPFSADDLGMK